ncbi:MAG: site-specific DNA-methyltransferase [Desulfurobacteriaceae bacterium]
MTYSTNDLIKELKKKLKEIFRFESEDLNFGIYRIMNYKRKEIERFIEEELIDSIKKQLAILNENEVENLEKTIYDHLISFFSRYYENGDFISKRRYGKKEKYCVPYNGEEIFLYWVNRDSYYIKTTEYFRRYTFKVKDITVNFRVVEAEEEKGNVKAQEKKFFVLNEKIFDFYDEKKELNVYFEYRSLTEEEKKKYGNQKVQEKINKETIKTLEDKIPQNSLATLIFEKSEKGEKTLIEKHLYRYTRRNTTDYFIHKNLKEFLERELDFYIKNEFLQLDDLQVLEQNDYFDKLKLYLTGVRVFRNIALKIVEFLAQIENFQKKIWEKKKFVIETNYVITLDKIKEYAGEKFLESILDEILSNKKQVNEWKELFEIEVKDKKDLIEKSTPENKEWKKLPVDTRYFNDDFKWKLLSALSEKNDLDNILDGILIKSENWQALNLLLNKYSEKIQTIYIDPPFNKEKEADYLYKVGYKDATWITMLENRIRLGRELLNDRGSIFVRCDYNGNMYVRLLLNEIFGKENFRNEIVVRRGSPKAGLFQQFNNLKSIGVMYDNLYWYSKNQEKVYGNFITPLSEKRQGYWTSFKKIYDRPTMRYEILGINLTKGQWMWSKERAYRAVENYKKYLEVAKKTGETLEEYWNRTGRKLEFVRRHGNSIQYWVPPKEETLLDNNWLDIPGYSSTTTFRTENSEILLKRVIESTSNENDLVLDFFLGSGTTTAVAHKLKRKWIGIEMGEHFWTVILPRTKKVLFYDKSGISKEKDVKEKYNEKTAGGFFKYHTLEQYEDALENVEFEKSQETLYELSDYFVKYMLEWETKNSKTFLNIDELGNPFNYKMKIIENYQEKVVNVDIVETFNYLLGLHIKGYKVLKDNERKYIFVFGEKEGKRIVIVWRNIKNIDFESDREIIEKQIGDFSPDEIYINGDATVKGFKPIEPLFKSLIFERVW